MTYFHIDEVKPVVDAVYLVSNGVQICLAKYVKMGYAYESDDDPPVYGFMWHPGIPMWSSAHSQFLGDDFKFWEPINLPG